MDVDPAVNERPPCWPWWWLWAEERRSDYGTATKEKRRER